MTANSNIFVGHTNRANTTTITGGSWYSGLEITKLATPRLADYAKSTSLRRSHTRFRATFAANYAMRAFALVKHNLSAAARWRVRAGTAPLDLLFDDEKAQDERIAFSGGVNGTRTDSRGRICLATRTNRVPQSNAFNHGSAWVRTNVTCATTAPGPLGFGDLAVPMVETSANGYHHLDTASFSGLVIGSTYTASIYAKVGIRSFIEIVFDDGVNRPYVVADLVNATAIVGGTTGALPVVEPVGSFGWYRVSVTLTAAATSATVQIFAMKSSSEDIYTGTAGATALTIYGAQLELGSFATDYIPTTTTAATVTDPRMDYEVLATNLQTYSEEFDSTTWSKMTGVAVTANAAIAPNGTLTADTMNYDGSGLSGSYRIYSAGIQTNGALCTLSIHLRSDTPVTLVLGCNLGQFTTCVITSAWTRFAVSTVGTVGNAQLLLYSPGGTNTPFAGVELWGAQIERSATMHDYIPTGPYPVNATAPVGLLMEESRTNLTDRSEEFDHANWTKVNATISTNSVTAPNAGAADTITSTAAFATSSISRGIAIANDSATLTWSIFCKLGTLKSLRLRLALVNGTAVTGAIDCNLSSGQITVTEASAGSGIVDVGGGWFRVWVSVTNNSSGNTSAALQVYPAALDAPASLGSLCIWGAQLEVGSFPTSYIPTTTTPVTRTLDAAAITGSNFTDFYDPRGGTLYAEYIPRADTLSAAASINDGTYNYDVVIYKSVASKATWPELVTNGTFTTNINSWSASNSATLSRDTSIFASGAIKVVCTSATEHSGAAQAIATVIGKRYYLSVDVYAPSTNTASNAATVSIESDPRSTSILSTQASSEDTVQTLSLHFTATSTDTTIYLFVLDRSIAWGSIGDLAYFDNISVREVASLGHLLVYDNSVIQADVFGDEAPIGSIAKCAGSFAANNYAYCGNAGAIGTDNSGTIPAVTQLTLGNRAGAGTPLNGHLRRVTYWPTTVNVPLQTITGSGGPDAIGYSSGWMDALRMTFHMDPPATWGEEYMLHTLFDAVPIRYATFEIDDTTNADGYVILGRLFAGDGFQPTINASYGLKDFRTDLSSVLKNLTGQRFTTARRRQKMVAYSFGRLTKDEGAYLHQLQGAAGVLDEVLYVPYPDDAGASQQYGFLGNLSALDPLVFPFIDFRSGGMQMEEKL